MSYILEALRKSERQRREIAEQPLARLTAAPPRERSRWRVTIVVLSTLTNVVVLAYLCLPVLFPKHPEASLPSSSPAAPLPKPAAAKDEAIRTDQPAAAAEGPTGSEPEPIVSTPRESIRSVKPKPAPPSSGVKVTPPSRVAKQAPRQRQAIPAAEEEAERTDSPVGPLARLGTARLSEPAPDAPERSRPAADHGGLPQPKINVYAYTARVDGDRFVIIRNRKYREGDRIDEGPVVRRIEEHGMTLEFAGQTYRIPRP